MNVFRYVLDKHAPLKTKTIRGNQAPFMTKNLSNAIMNRSRLKGKNYQPKKDLLIFQKGFVSNKTFWNTVKPFLTNKGLLTNGNIAIKCFVEIITDTTKLADIFNTRYINIVEKPSGTPSSIL